MCRSLDLEFSLGSHHGKKTAEKRGFCEGVTDRPTDGPMHRDGRTDGWTDRPSYHLTNLYIDTFN